MADSPNTVADDQDELAGYPSAANPLTAMGIDPDEARANPSLLAPLQPGYVQPSADASVLPWEKPGFQAVPQLTNDAPAQGSQSAQGMSASGGAAIDPPASSLATDMQQGGARTLSNNVNFAEDAANSIQINNPELKGMVARRDALGIPGAPYDPQTGKLSKQVSEQVVDPGTGELKTVTVTVNPKPSGWARVGRGVRGGLVGFLTGGIPGALVGAIEPQDIRGGTAYGAPSTAYQRLDQQRTADLGNTDSDILNNLKARKDAVDAANAKNKLYLDIAKTGNDQVTAGTGIANAQTAASRVPIEQQNANTATQNANNNSPDAKLQLSQQQVDQRTAQANRLGLKGSQRAMWILNGKLPEPQQMNEAQYNTAQVNRVLGSYRATHGGQDPQTAEDWNKLYASTRGELKNGAQQMMVPDGKGGMVLTDVKPGDTVPAGATTVAGMVGNAKTASAATAKEAAAAQEIVDTADLAHQAATEAENGNAEGDVDLALSFFKTMKGSTGSGIRFTQAEQNMIKGARNTGGDITAAAQKVLGGGQMFTKDQRANVLRIIDLHAQAAKSHIAPPQGAGTPAASGADPLGILN